MKPRAMNKNGLPARVLQHLSVEPQTTKKIAERVQMRWPETLDFQDSGFSHALGTLVDHGFALRGKAKGRGFEWSLTADGEAELIRRWKEDHPEPRAKPQRRMQAAA